jgi:hypothetical protein
MMLRRLKHPEYLITHFLAHYGIDYTRVDSNPNFVVIHPLWGNYLQHNKGLLTDLPSSIKDNLKQGTATLLFWYPYETENYADPSVTRQIENLIDTLDFDLAKSCYVTGNLNTEAFDTQHRLVRSCEKAFYKKIKKAREKHALQDIEQANQIWNQQKINPFMSWMKKHYPDWADEVHSMSLHQVLARDPNLPNQYNRNILANDLMKIAIQDSNKKIVKVPLMMFDMQLHEHLVRHSETDQIVRDHWFNWNKSKSFMCLNGKAKPHRRYCVQQILQNQLDQHGAVSYVCYDGQDPQQPAIVLDQSAHQVRRNDRWMNPELYNDCWINIVTEAYSQVEHNLFITEKTFKPMLQLQPFMLIGNKGSLSYLRDCGYKTFDSLWSERYDQLDTVQERTDAVIRNLNAWCMLSQQDKQNKIKSVFDDLLHNQEMVCNTSRDVTRSAYLLDTANAMSSGG